jgi:tetratricopeptide (TPR) repeat protein
MSQGVYNAAAQFFLDYRKATEFREPDFADATVNLVKAYIMADAYDKAAEAMEFHRGKSQGLTETYFLHALQYWRAVVLRAQGKLQESTEAALPLLDRTVDAELRNQALYLLADLSLLQQRWQEAESYLQRLIQEFPSAPNLRSVRMRLITVWLVTNRLPQAEVALADLAKDASEADRADIERARVLVLLQKGDLSGALEAYKAIAGQRPKRPDGEWWLSTSSLAGALAEASRFEEALTVLPQVSALALTDDQRVDSLLRTAEAQISLKRIPQAIDTLERFKREYAARPEVVPSLVRLAELLRETNNAITAAAYFAEVMVHPGATPAFRYRAAISRAWCLKDAGVPEQAAKVFAEAENLGTTPQEKARAVFLAAETAFGVGSYADAALNYAAVGERYRETEFAEEARFRQGRALFEMKRFADAAAAYARFVSEYPQSATVQTARLERAIALRYGAGSREEFQAALAEFRAFIAQYPESAILPRALMEGFEAALGAGDWEAALECLTTVIGKHTDSELYPHALYHRAMVHFMQADDEKAVADANAFIAKFSALPIAPDILLQLGDYYSNHKDYEKAKECFSELAGKHPLSTLAPTALYEAALCSYRLEHLGSTTLLLDQLLATDNPKPKAEELARAELLYGDALALQDQYEKAIPHFAKARQIAGETRLGLAAEGRRGEMLYSLATTDKARLEEAIQCFTALTEARSTPADLWELAVYRLAKCHEAAGDNKRAVTRYLEVFYQYEQDRKQNRRRDYLYLVRSIYDAARLLEISGTKADMSQAATLYEYLADLELPTAEDARRRARQIRERHDLSQ